MLPVKQINYKDIWLLSDLHFGVHSNSLEWLDNQLSFFNNFYIPLLKEKADPNDILFILGDFFDNKELLDVKVFNNSMELVYQLSKILPVYFIVGNHDIYKKEDTDINSLIGFKYIPNVTIFEQPTIIKNNNSSILLLPWIGNSENEEEIAKEYATDANYIFAHTELNGFKYDTGKPITKGVKLRDIKEYKKIFSGHIHKGQESNHMYYIGSPYHTKRGDIGNDKKVYVFDPKNNSYQTFINNISPIYQRIHLNDLLEYTLEKTINILTNNYTDIIVPDKYIHQFNLTKFIEIIKGCNYKKIEAYSESKKVDDDISEVSNNTNIKDIITLLEDSIEEMDLLPDEIERLKELNNIIYKSIKTNI